MMMTSSKCRPRNSTGRFWLTVSTYQNADARFQQIHGAGQAETELPKRKVSAAARRRMAKAQRLRWKKIKHTAEQPSTKTAKPKRKMSASARKRIAAAQKKRWAAIKKV